jgi:hypothetical protein
MHSSESVLRALSYLLVPEPAPVGVMVEPLGDAFGLRSLPLGLRGLVLFIPAEPDVPPVVLPFIDEPLVLPLAEEPPAALPPPAPDPEPPACASANVLDNANAAASAIVLIFMIVSSRWLKTIGDMAFGSYPVVSSSPHSNTARSG